ncbi:hypothetical protein ACP3TD_00920 [Pseudarthrobacter sp. 1G09]|uniref:hypothetical protein n=1 Tax=Pseudarthrobacter sp. 1G09 TaxID=3416178 RepID=UPI003CEA55E0
MLFQQPAVEPGLGWPPADSGQELADYSDQGTHLLWKAQKFFGTAIKAATKKEFGHKESPKNGTLKFGERRSN